VLKQASREGLTEVKVRRNGASFTVQWQQVGDSAFTDYEADIR
jgi:hypothetical protein